MLSAILIALSKYQGAHLERSDAAFDAKFRRERRARKLNRRDVRQERARVYVNGMAARRLHDGYAGRGQPVPQICSRPDAILQIIFVEGLVQTYGDGFEVAPR